MKLADKAVYRAVSESPGRNASEPNGGPDKNKPQRPSLLLSDEGNRIYRRLTNEAYPSGGVVGTAR